MKTVVKGEMLILMPENAAEAAALARWRDGRDGQALELLPNTGPGATIRFRGPPAENEANGRHPPAGGEERPSA
jgi:hypothetical protein